MRNVITGIDIGSQNIRVVVARFDERNHNLDILSLTKGPSGGLRNGYIANVEELRHSLGLVLRDAANESGVRIRDAVVAANGIGLSTYKDTGSAAISKADKEVTELDIAHAIKESEKHISGKPNVQVVHTVPTAFKLDGKKLIGKPEGLHADKIEVQTLFVASSLGHINDLTKVVEENGVRVLDIFAGPIAESFVTLTTAEKNAGCCLANIGAESISIATFEEGMPTSLKVFPLGSSDISKDIALGLKVGLEEAENIKLGQMEVERREERQVREIVEARLKDIFDIIDSHLRKIGRSGLLPAGIILSGEGSKIPGVAELAKKYLNLPARLAENHVYRGGKASKIESHIKENNNKIKGGEWSVAYGLSVLGLDIESEESLGIKIASKAKSRFLDFLRQLLP